MSLNDKSASFTNHGVVERTALSAYTRGYVEGISLTGQPYCSLKALQNSCLIKLEPISRRGITVSHTDDPFAAARSSTCIIFGGALTLVSLSFPGLLQLITLCADLLRDSSGGWCV